MTIGGCPVAIPATACRPDFTGICCRPVGVGATQKAYLICAASLEETGTMMRYCMHFFRKAETFQKI